MTELKFTVNVPSKLESEFVAALERVIKEFIDELEFSVARDILSKSKLTKKQADKFADEVKKGMAKTMSGEVQGDECKRTTDEVSKAYG